MGCRPRATPSQAEWHSNQSAYWDHLKEDYDRLYADVWSQRENTAVQASLATLDLPPAPSVLDLACGTGLGAELIKHALGPITYYGRDISAGMLEKCYYKHEDAQLSCGSMTDLEDYPSSFFHLITCLFAAASYAYSLERLLQQAARILKPNGYLYLSCLSRTALRRLVRLRFSSIERFRTRGDTSSLVAPPVITYRRADLERLLKGVPYSVISIEGMGALSGVIQWKALWGLNVSLSRTVPSVCHTLEVITQRRIT